MGNNCHKTRLCQCLHNSHCHLLSLLGRYQNLFNFGHNNNNNNTSGDTESSDEDDEDNKEQVESELQHNKEEGDTVRKKGKKGQKITIVDSRSSSEHNQLSTTTAVVAAAAAAAVGPVVSSQPKGNTALATPDSGAAIFAAPLSAIAAVAAASASRDSNTAAVFHKNYCDLHQIYSDTKTRTFRHYHHYHPNNIKIPSLPAGSQTTLHSVKSISTFDSTLPGCKTPANRQRSASHCPKVCSPLVTAKSSPPTSGTGLKSPEDLEKRLKGSASQAVVASSSRSDVEVPGYKPSGCINSKCYCHSRQQQQLTSVAVPSPRPLKPTAGLAHSAPLPLNTSGRGVSRRAVGGIGACSSSSHQVESPTIIASITTISSTSGSSNTSGLTLAQQEQQAKRASSLRTLNKRFGYPTIVAGSGVANPTTLPPGKAGTGRENHHQPHESLRLSNSGPGPSTATAAGMSSSSSKSGVIDHIYNPNTNYYMPSSNHNFRVIDHQLNNGLGTLGGGSSAPKRSGSARGRKSKQAMKLNDLNNECLLNIMSHLTLAERLICERVSRRWQHVVRLSLQAPASLKIGEHSVKCNCTCSHYPSWDLPPSAKFKRDEGGYIMYPHSILCYLLTICKNLRCLNFSHCYLDDQTLQIIMAHSDMIECMHLYDIRLEADSTEDVLLMEKAAGKLGNGHEHSQPESLSSAMSAFATEQLAVFGGLMRRLSTRKPPAGVANLVASKNVAKERDRLLVEAGNDAGKPKMACNLKGSKKVAKKKAEVKQASDLSLAFSAPESMNKKVVGAPSSLEISSPVRNVTVDSRQTPATPSSEATSTALTATERRATQRRREWSRHRSDIKRLDATLGSDDEPAISPAGTSGGDKSQEDLTAHQQLDQHAVAGPSNRRLLSPSVAPNLASLVADFDRKMSFHPGELSDDDNDIARVGAGGLYGGDEDESEMIEIESAIVEEEYNRMIQNRALQQHYNGRGGDSSSHGHSHSSSHHKHGGGGSSSNSIAARLNDIQAFVALEQVKTECRQTHLLQWKSFVKKLGAQITSLSIGALNSVDQIVIDILMKYCEVLEELRINNEIDILSYMTYLKDSVKRIHINCEHGVGMEVVSMLAFRNYAEKVVNLGRIAVRPEHIDSVISTIGSNFINLRTLQLRLEEHDIDVATPASILFSNLRELNLQFGNGNVDRPFKKLLQLGWASVRSLTLQYGSLTEEAVRSIGVNMPQLRKVVLHAVEFRCDHQGRRYGHRICTNCSHAVWKAIAYLPHLTHLRLHRVIIDEEICKALYRMSRLATLELHFCQNVNDNVVGVCAELAKRNPKRRFTLDIISRNFVNYHQPPLRNLTIELKVVGR